MNIITEKKYTGDGGNAQRIFILDFQVGRKAILNDPTRHLGGGVAQYDYMETLLNRLGGQARRLLEKYLYKWNWLKNENPYILDAIAREADRATWRTFYSERAVYNLGRVHMVVPVPNPTRPDLMEDPIDDACRQGRISWSDSDCFPVRFRIEDLMAFRPQPREALVKLAPL